MKHFTRAAHDVLHQHRANGALSSNVKRSAGKNPARGTEAAPTRRRVGCMRSSRVGCMRSSNDARQACRVADRRSAHMEPRQASIKKRRDLDRRLLTILISWEAPKLRHYMSWFDPNKKKHWLQCQNNPAAWLVHFGKISPAQIIGGLERSSRRSKTGMKVQKESGHRLRRPPSQKETPSPGTQLRLGLGSLLPHLSLRLLGWAARRGMRCRPARPNCRLFRNCSGAIQCAK